MARDTLVEGSTLTAIADAIREKTETSDVMYPSEMAGKILAIEGASAGQYIWKKSTACLESSGTQYIDLGVKPNQNTKVEVDFEALSGSSSDPTVFGAWDTQISNAFMFIVSKTLGSCLSFYGSNYKEHTLDMTGRHTAVVDKNATSVDGNTVITLASATFSGGYPMYLFAYNDKGNAGNIPSSIKIYSCKVYDNGSLVRDVVPYVDGDGVACVYDKVSASCLYNAGTGVFAVSGASDGVYIADNDENKYPDGGVLDGYYYKKIEIPNLSDATATAEDILEGKTAYVSEGKATGALALELISGVDTNVLYKLPSATEEVIGTTQVPIISFVPKYNGTIYIVVNTTKKGSSGNSYVKCNNVTIDTNTSDSNQANSSGNATLTVKAGTTYTVKYYTSNSSTRVKVNSLTISGWLVADKDVVTVTRL